MGAVALWLMLTCGAVPSGAAIHSVAAAPRGKVVAPRRGRESHRVKPPRSGWGVVQKRHLKRLGTQP